MAKLLIADDNTIFCQNLAIQFRHENYVVDIAEDGEAALEFLSRYKYDVAILDWDMPLYSGMYLP